MCILNPNLQKIKFVKDSANIIDVVSHFVPLKKRGVNYVGKSPFSNERSASFNVNPVKNFFKCFSSGKSGDVIDFVMSINGLDKWAAIEWITDFCNMPKVDPEYKFISRVIPPVSYIDKSVFCQTIQTGHPNYFVNFLRSKFDIGIAFGCVENYNIGTSKHWPGATIFWQVDIYGKIRSGKIMVYNPITGKRIKEPVPLITWAHQALRLRDFNLDQCLFGEHLLITRPNANVGIVESEKTAIIASIRYPADLWLASGSLNNLSVSRCSVLKGRTVTLYPDRGAEDIWMAKMRDLQELIPASWHFQPLIGNFPKGYDLCDYILDERDGKI